jgi:hypothetical protein
MRDDGTFSHLYSFAGDPVVSAYLDLKPEPDGTQWGLPLRWRRLRDGLRAGGAVEEMLRPLDERARRVQPADRTVVMFSRGGRLELAEELVDCDVPDVAAVGPLPLAVPLLRWTDTWVPYLVVQADRSGGDISAYPGAGSAVLEEEVVGPDDVIERNAPGGMAQLRYQHRAEDSWAHNAAAVAQRVTRLAASTGAQLVVTAGDVRAVQELTDHLPERVRLVQRVVTSGLAQTTPGRVRVQPVIIRDLVHETATMQRTRVLAELNEARGGGPAVTGTAGTTGALRRGAVRQLLVVDRPGDDRQAEIGPEPSQLSPAVAAQETADGPLVPLREALVRAALAQSAEVTVFGPEEAELADGVGALLRY